MLGTTLRTNEISVFVLGYVLVVVCVVLRFRHQFNIIRPVIPRDAVLVVYVHTVSEHLVWVMTVCDSDQLMNRYGIWYFTVAV